MLAPDFTRKIRDSAQLHVQVSVATVSVPATFSGGECRIAVVVEKVFRGAELLPPGSYLELIVHCFVPPDRPPTGPRWLDFDRMKSGAFLEAFLNKSRDGLGYEVAMWQLDFIDALTEIPRLLEDTSEPAKEGFFGSFLHRFFAWKRK
jgi:hypothetical protein